MRQIPLPLPHTSSMGADDFLVTPSNQEAVAWIDAWPAWPTHGLILTGPPGSGKTHLSSLWLTKTRGRIITETDLMNGYPHELLASSTLIAIEDVDKFAGKRPCEETLFHVYNHLKDVKGSLLLTMTLCAERAGFNLPDLRSRLLTLPATVLGPPDDHLLEALIVKQFRDRQLRIDPGVITYLIPRIPRDAAGIRGLINRLDRAALAEGRKVSVTLAKRVLGDHDE